MIPRSSAPTRAALALVAVLSAAGACGFRGEDVFQGARAASEIHPYMEEIKSVQDTYREAGQVQRPETALFKKPSWLTPTNTARA